MMWQRIPYTLNRPQLRPVLRLSVRAGRDDESNRNDKKDVVGPRSQPTNICVLSVPTVIIRPLGKCTKFHIIPQIELAQNAQHKPTENDIHVFHTQIFNDTR